VKAIIIVQRLVKLQVIFFIYKLNCVKEVKVTLVLDGDLILNHKNRKEVSEEDNNNHHSKLVVTTIKNLLLLQLRYIISLL